LFSLDRRPEEVGVL